MATTKIPRKIVKILAISAGSGKELSVISGPPFFGSEVQIAEVGTFDDSVMTTIAGTLPKYKSGTFTALDEGQAYRPIAGEVFDLTMTATYDNSAGGTITKTFGPTKVTVIGVTPAVLEIGGNRVSTLEIECQPIGGDDGITYNVGT